MLAAASDETPLAVRIALAREANQARARAWAYREHQATIHFDRNGKETERRSKTWDVIGLEGALYRKLVERDDHPLAAKEAQKEEAAMQQEAATRRKEKNGGMSRLFSASYNFSIPWSTLGTVYDLTVSGEEEIAGEPVQVVEGVAKSARASASPEEREAGNYSLRLWIRKSDGLPIRTSLEVTGTHSRMKPGSKVVQEIIRGSDGTWLPGTAEITYVLKVAGAFAARGVSTYTYTEFKKFQVDSELTTDGR